VEAQGLDSVYEKIDLPLAGVLAEMERAGILVDPDALAKMSHSMEERSPAAGKRDLETGGVGIQRELADATGGDSVRQAEPATTGAAGQRQSAIDGGGHPGRDEEQHELPAKVIEYREIAKLKSTYVDALPKLIHPETKRLHTSFSQTGTATGRLSSSDPNLQNIPIRSELGREIRAAFVAQKGQILLSADYSQIELRIMAHFSKDPVLTEAFRTVKTSTQERRRKCLAWGPMAQTAEHRRAAKAINFGIIYGFRRLAWRSNWESSKKRRRNSSTRISRGIAG